MSRYSFIFTFFPFNFFFVDINYMFGYIHEYNDIYRYNLCQQKIKKEDRMNAKQAIENLRIMSATLENAANRPENYNTPYSQYLENISYEMFKHANQLQELDYLYGIAL